MHFVFENICRKRVRRQMTIWERLKSRVCWARLWGSVWRPPDMNMKLRHKKHFWGWATKPECCRKRETFHLQKEWQYTYLLSLSQLLSLQAASFGKCFLSNFPPEQFVSMCRDLRVLNAVRDYTVGIPLTHTQYKQMTVQVLIDRWDHKRI